MKEGMLLHEDRVYDERVILDKAYNKVKTAHETGKRSYYKIVLNDELTCFPVFMQRWFELAKIDFKTSVGLTHEKEYEQFRAIYYTLRYEYEIKYRWRNLKTLLQLIANQDNIVFQKELKDKNLSYLFTKYGILDYGLIDKVLNKANISDSDIVNKSKMELLIRTCSELEKEDLNKQKIDVVLRENILNPFGNLNIE